MAREVGTSAEISQEKHVERIRQNALGQPVGEPLPGWTPPALPPREPMQGRFCRLEPLDVEAHTGALHEAFAADGDGRGWTYLAYGPFDDAAGLRAWVRDAAAGDDPQFFAILDADGRAVGVASYLRISPASGSIEVGHIHYAPVLAGTPAATEAMVLMARRVFGLGYRRYEWKCDALNAPSRRAAQRLGFSYESVFRQATVYKGRNRDTAWYAMLDGEWPALDDAWSRWLDPANFDASGRQRSSLSALVAPLLAARG